MIRGRVVSPRMGRGDWNSSKATILYRKASLSPYGERGLELEHRRCILDPEKSLPVWGEGIGILRHDAPQGAAGVSPRMGRGDWNLQMRAV